MTKIWKILIHNHIITNIFIILYLKQTHLRPTIRAANTSSNIFHIPTTNKSRTNLNMNNACNSVSHIRIKQTKRNIPSGWTDYRTIYYSSWAMTLLLLLLFILHHFSLSKQTQRRAEKPTYTLHIHTPSRTSSWRTQYHHHLC